MHRGGSRLAHVSLAQPLTTTWTYQGKLLNVNNPATGAFDIRYRLFESAAGGAQVGVDLFALNTTLTDGTFATQLNFGTTAFNGNRRWVEIAVKSTGGGTYTTLTPRQEVTASPYSLFALNVAASAMPWNFSGANATYVGTGNVGAGTASPTAKLHIVGTDSGTGQSLNANNKFYVTGTFVGVNRNLPVASSEAFGVQAPVTGNNYGGMYIRTDSANGKPFYGYSNTGGATMWTYLDGVDNSWRVNMSNIDRLAIASNGNIGIGTTSPAQKLDVHGGVSNTDFTINPGSLFGVANASAVTLDTSGTGTIGVWDNFSINNNLSVVGTSTFASSAAFNNGGAPFTVANNTKVTNLNADLFDGLDSTSFLTSIPNPLALAGSTPATGTITGTNSSTTTNSAGVRGISTGATGSVWGVWGTASALAGAGVFGINSTAGGTGVRGLNNAATGGGVGVFGQVNSTSDGAYGLYGSAISGGRGVVGDSTSGDGVWGVSASGTGVRATTDTGGIALYAERTSNGNKGWFGGLNEGGWAESNTGDGFIAKAFAANKSGIYCENTNSNGNAIYANGKGYFVGEISVPVITIRGGADLAEPFDVASSPVTDQRDATIAGPGMLVVIDAENPGKLMVSSESYDTKVAGIISGANGLAPGLTLRAIDHQHADGDHAVAMTGRVWCFVDASYGAITPGDRLTTSPTPGHAMKVTDDTRAPGSVVGKAMTPLATGEKGLVLVLVNLQ